MASIRLCEAGNLVQALKEFDRRGYEIAGMVPQSGEILWETSFQEPTVLVVGAEDRGLRTMVRRSCTRLVRIPQRQVIQSLNVASACSVGLYEIFRQRRIAQARGKKA